MAGEMLLLFEMDLILVGSRANGMSIVSALRFGD
jgi:hypothetical protein